VTNITVTSVFGDDQEQAPGYTAPGANVSQRFGSPVR
jgi:hypothetical protein